jgi:hypothetical protein
LRVGAWRPLPAKGEERFPVLQRAYEVWRRHELLGALVFGVSTPFVFMLGDMAMRDPRSLFWSVPLACAATAGAFRLDAKMKRERRSLKASLGESECEAARGDFPAVLSFGAGSFTYARDVGLFAFADGWLVFEGNRTSFSLRPQDVEFQSDSGRIGLRVSYGDVWIDAKSMDGSDLRTTLREWTRTRRPVDGQPELAPIHIPYGERPVLGSKQVSVVTKIGYTLAFLSLIANPYAWAFFFPLGFALSALIAWVWNAFAKRTAVRLLREESAKVEAWRSPVRRS